LLTYPYRPLLELSWDQQGGGRIDQSAHAPSNAPSSYGSTFISPDVDSERHEPGSTDANASNVFDLLDGFDFSEINKLGDTYQQLGEADYKDFFSFDAL
jgi:hypothetical protein